MIYLIFTGLAADGAGQSVPIIGLAGMRRPGGLSSRTVTGFLTWHLAADEQRARPEPIEVAAYYVASEALANSAKHAQASHMEVSLATHNGSLVLSIRDDGVGGADAGRG